MEFRLIKQAGSLLAPATAEDAEILSGLPVGAFLEVNATSKRNPAFHRKFFSLLNLGFEYWTPMSVSLSQVERNVIRNYTNFLISFGANRDAMENAAETFLSRWEQKRSERVVQIVKSFDAYRRWATVEAGYFSEMVMPNGVIVKEPISIKFSKMDETTFRELYKSVFNVLWTYILSRTFKSEHEAESTVNQLMGYAA
jgi:Protein of unknown function (DUF1367).